MLSQEQFEKIAEASFEDELQKIALQFAPHSYPEKALIQRLTKTTPKVKNIEIAEALRDFRKAPISIKKEFIQAIQGDVAPEIGIPTGRKMTMINKIIKAL